MTTHWAVELSDAGVTALAGDGRRVGPWPGYALIDGDRTTVGPDAAAVARVRPRQVDDRFLAALDDAPLGRPFPHGLRQTDLAHTFLSRLAGEMGDISGVLLAVSGPADDPGDYLGRLLGIAGASGLTIDALVDPAVAAAAASARPAGRLVHLDLGLHEMRAVELVQSDDQVVSGRLQTSDRVGLSALQQTWMRAIARRFVQLTRFDPLHAAASEQALFDRLPAWLDQLRGGSTIRAALPLGGTERAIELEPRHLSAAVADAYRDLTELVRSLADGAVAVLVSDRAARLPGLEAAITEIGLEVILLPPAAAASGLLRFHDLLADPAGDLTLVDRLPAPAARATTGRTAPAATGQRPSQRAGALPPTHLIYGARAYPITAEPLQLGTATDGTRSVALHGATAGVSRDHCRILRTGDQIVVEDRSSYGTFLNGTRIDGRATLGAGDRLRLGSPGIELLLVAETVE